MSILKWVYKALNQWIEDTARKLEEFRKELRRAEIKEAIYGKDWFGNDKP